MEIRFLATFGGDGFGEAALGEPFPGKGRAIDTVFRSNTQPVDIFPVQPESLPRASIEEPYF